MFIIETSKFEKLGIRLPGGTRASSFPSSARPDLTATQSITPLPLPVSRTFTIIVTLKVPVKLCSIFSVIMPMGWVAYSGFCPLGSPLWRCFPRPARCRHHVMRVRPVPYLVSNLAIFGEQPRLEMPPPATGTSQDLRYEDCRHTRLVLFPVGAILHRAEVVISDRSVDKEDRKVDGIEVGKRRGGAAAQAPGESHHPVARVVDLARHAPPAGGEQTRAASCLHVPVHRARRVCEAAGLRATRWAMDRLWTSWAVQGSRRHRQRMVPTGLDGRAACDGHASMDCGMRVLTAGVRRLEPLDPDGRRPFRSWSLGRPHSQAG